MTTHLIRIFSALLVLLLGCMPPPRPSAAELVAEPRDVAIATVCKSIGSGVVIDDRHVVTALHVVSRCPDVVIVRDGSRVDRAAQVEIVDLRRDVARLVLSDASLPFEVRPVRVAEPEPGAPVCLRSGLHREERCGYVDAASERLDGLRHTAPTRPGDSGAGLYRLDGTLVGIATTCNVTDQGACSDTGGGGASMLAVAWVTSGTAAQVP